MAVNSKIVCISDRDDAHVPYVKPYLSDEFVLVCERSISEGTELSFAFERGELRVVYDGRELSAVKSVWLRKPQLHQNNLRVPRGYERYSFTTIRNHAHALRSLFPDAFWLSDYYTVLKASSKARQLQVASSLGFNVPDTLSTTSQKAAAKFLASHGDCVVKSQATWLPSIGGSFMHFPTSKISAGKRVNLSGLHLAPPIFQKAIDAELELRITVVGGEVFTASIRDDPLEELPDAVRDWRMSHAATKTKFEPYDLPTSLKQKCLRLVKAFGLPYGAIDIIIDKKGKPWFLEINPNGQWAFVEKDTGLPIGKAVAGVLTRGT